VASREAARCARDFSEAKFKRAHPVKAHAAAHSEHHLRRYRKRARRRAYIVRKTRLGYTMTRGNTVVVAGKLIDIATYLEAHT
jgi:hypothetical protein